ncbi:hypothetical protein CWE21_00570 [Pseudidiomarina aquimaris]|uniref:Uncharacterized protein n=1 Tax=Pseudidiomarina aquimaris TaxID=641841 RepID=A0A432XPP4_9GAMM|nr:hypothetical protein CWE21_00570 [Pseudidiomarina aquimaris]|tara:strand:- start:1490 stop:1768 length:279 start_codon:yes stop_codon:yes gene_type:complete
MNKPKILVLISVVLLTLIMVGCAAPNSRLSGNDRVLMANDELIRFVYELNQSDLSELYNYAAEHCSKLNKRAEQGTRTCDGNRCEIAYFCEG